MPEIIIGFSTPKTWNPLSAAIMWLTDSKVSHAWLLVDDPVFKTRMVLEAHGTGMRLLPFQRFVKKSTVVALVRPSLDLSEGVVVAGSWLGLEYDLKGLLGVAWVLLGGWLRRKWRNPWNTPRSLFCSEAIVRMLQASKYPGASVLRPEEETPQSLLSFFHHDPTCQLIPRNKLTF